MCMVEYNHQMLATRLFYFVLISILLVMLVIAFCDEEGVRFQSMFLGSAAIACVFPVSTLRVLDKRLRHLKHLVEVIAFCDEEGVRFQSMFLGSAAIACVFPVSTLRSVRTDTNSGNKDKCLKDQLLDAKVPVEKAKTEMGQFWYQMFFTKIKSRKTSQPPLTANSRLQTLLLQGFHLVTILLQYMSHCGQCVHLIILDQDDTRLLSDLE
nr:allantoate deiminase 2 [Tanacetum cinerariifolium]